MLCQLQTDMGVHENAQTMEASLRCNDTVWQFD